MEMFLNMSSNLIALLIFSIAMVVVYYLIPRKIRYIVLLISSTLFYGLCDIKMLPVLLAATLFTWYCGLKIEKTKSKKWFVAGCVTMVLVLAFFKYNWFMIDGLKRLLTAMGIGASIGVAEILMPLGVSYYIFKVISYMVDIYKGKYSAEKNVLVYSTYVLFFPEIMSGPISRFEGFRKAIDEGMTYDKEKIQMGFYLILKGLFMKVVIANRLSDYVGSVFDKPGNYPGLALWMGAFFYSVQLYCDFGGYSSIAVGITQLFGLNYTENFRRPYFARNIKEFWDRWHISLSSWLKDYVYIPLGGNRCSKFRQKFNVIAVFFVSGLWHGVGVNFTIWGLIHGLLNVLTPKTGKEKRRGDWIRIIVNYCLVTVGWIFFGSKTLQTALEFIKSMFVNFSLSGAAIQRSILPFTGDNTCVAFFLVAMVFIVILFIRELFEEKKNLPVSKVASIPWQIFLLTAVLLFGEFSKSAFIYANF